MSSSVSLYSNNEQPTLLSHTATYDSHYGVPSLPSLSQVLTKSNTTIPTSMNGMEQTSFYSTQSPSTILSNTDSMSAISTGGGVGGGGGGGNPVDYTNDPMLTTAPMMTLSTASSTVTSPPMQDTVYLNQTTAATAAAIAATSSMVYNAAMLSNTSATTNLTTTPSSSAASMDALLSGMNPLEDATHHTMMPAYTYDFNGNNSRHRQDSISSTSSDSKVYSFVAIPGMNQKKRPRRRYDEIERLYHCTFPGCKKSYGTLNHLNSHVLMQRHGPKRHPSEFKEMRKEYRRLKKQREAQRKEMNQKHQEPQVSSLPPPSSTVSAQEPSLLYHHPSHPATTMTNTMYQPPIIPTNFTLQSMPLSGFY